ncbi:MAG: dienelactone hydrolase family protein [Novosphingobium sp.]|nr:dienelactone hydrolase family protein [Novosphingobium sp.]
MCDDFTDLAGQDTLARKTLGGGLTRRQFAALGPGAAALAACQALPEGPLAESDLAERPVSIQMGGAAQAPVADGFFVHPAKGAHPGIVMWPDIAGPRDAFKAMARRLAAAGHAVLVPNQYYRNAPAPVLDSFAQWRTPEGQEKLKPMIAAITPEGTLADAAAFVAFLDGQDAVDKARGVGACGYCMGGPFAVRTAVAVPNRVKAAASFHGAWLVGPEPHSPVNLLDRTQASFLFAIGRNDDEKAPGDKTALKQAADKAGRLAEVEVYPADHGWCVPDSPVYDAAQADRAWGRLLALFGKL